MRIRLPTLASRRGIALPVVILATALISVALVATFMTVGTERRVSDGYRSQLLAFGLAQTGIEQCTRNRVSCGFTGTVPSLAYDSQRVALTNGYADVVFERMRANVPGVTAGLYVVRSRGVLTRLRNANDPPAQRIVAQLATWRPLTMNVMGGITSLSGLAVNGNAATLTGVPPTTGPYACPGAPAVAGVVVPTGGYSPGPAPVGGVRTLGTAAQAVDSVGIDWDAIVNGNAIIPTVAIPGGSWPAASTWSVIKATGDLSVGPGNSGKGLLIVTGNLTMSGSFTWDGAILVGGVLTSNGNQTIGGAVVAGLNAKLGAVVGASDLGNGNKTIGANPCLVTQALAAASVFTPYGNAWMDTWKSY